MGTRQTKGCAAPGSGGSPPTAPGNCARRKASSRERGGDFLASLVARSSEKFGKGAGLPPYHRRIGMIQDMLRLVKQGRQDEATDLLKHLRQVRGRAGGGLGTAPPGGGPAGGSSATVPSASLRPKTPPPPVWLGTRTGGGWGERKNRFQRLLKGVALLGPERPPPCFPLGSEAWGGGTRHDWARTWQPARARREVWIAALHALGCAGRGGARREGFSGRPRSQVQALGEPGSGPGEGVAGHIPQSTPLCLAADAFSLLRSFAQDRSVPATTCALPPTLGQHLSGARPFPRRGGRGCASSVLFCPLLVP